MTSQTFDGTLNNTIDNPNCSNVATKAGKNYQTNEISYRVVYKHTSNRDRAFSHLMDSFANEQRKTQASRSPIGKLISAIG